MSDEWLRREVIFVCNTFCVNILMKYYLFYFNYLIKLKLLSKLENRSKQK